jgi:hypothetical protein
MKKFAGLFLLIVLPFVSCLSTGTTGNSNRLEERVLIDTVTFTDDELEIYDILVNILITKNSTYVPKETMAELVNKYSMEDMRQNPQLIKEVQALIEDAAIPIENPKIVVSDRTTIPSLRKNKTFDENMESSSKFINEKIGEEYNVLFLDFKKKNENDYSLTEYITRNDTVISNDLVRAAIGDVGPDAYWSKFYEINPNACGSVTFSRVGFSGNKAILEIEFMQGSMNGFIDYIILEKSGDTWAIIKSGRYIIY